MRINLLSEVRYDDQDRQTVFLARVRQHAEMGTDDELVIVRGEGCEVFDRDGKRYLDATAALWFCNVGYGRQAIVEAVERQMRDLPAYSTFGLYANEPGPGAERAYLKPDALPEGKVFLTCDGSGAVDTAAKMVRRYWNEVGKPESRSSSAGTSPTTGWTPSAPASPASPPTPRAMDNWCRASPKYHMIR